MRVRLIAYSKPIIGEEDPRRLVLLAIKISAGKLHQKDVEYYLKEYPREKLRDWMIDAIKYPSVLEHIVFTFLIEDISRVCSHQLVRHRIASYTQESQRYSGSYIEKAIKCIEENKKEISECIEESFVMPPSTNRDRTFMEFLLNSLKMYRHLIEDGVHIEDARYAIPQSIKTRILMTVNLRELLHIACLRISSKAQWEIRELVKAMIIEVSKVIPEVLDLLDRMCGIRFE